MKRARFSPRPSILVLMINALRFLFDQLTSRGYQVPDALKIIHTLTTRITRRSIVYKGIEWMAIISDLHGAIVPCDRAQEALIHTFASHGSTLASKRYPFRSTIVRTAACSVGVKRKGIQRHTFAVD